MRNTIYFLFFLLTLLSACSKSIDKSRPTLALQDVVLPIPNQIVDKSALYFNTKNSTWTLDGTLYSGYAKEYYPNGTTKGEYEFIDGKMQNQAIRFFSDGHLKLLENYYKGKLHGEKKMWSLDTPHILVSHLNYSQGKLHGEQKKWYPSGELFKKLNMNMGREEGIQQAFRKNGVLYANYEAKEGRIFGLKKAALCFDLEEEKIREGQ